MDMGESERREVRIIDRRSRESVYPSDHSRKLVGPRSKNTKYVRAQSPPFDAPFSVTTLRTAWRFGCKQLKLHACVNHPSTSSDSTEPPATESKRLRKMSMPHGA